MKFTEKLWRLPNPDAPFKQKGEQIELSEMPEKIRLEIERLLSTQTVSCQAGSLELSAFRKEVEEDGTEIYAAYGSRSHNNLDDHGGGYRGTQQVRYRFRLKDDDSIESKQDVTQITK